MAAQILPILSFISFITAQRYGQPAMELCPSGVAAQLTKDGNAVWCRSDIDCASQHACTPSGAYHFGSEIHYCCPTRVSICTLPPSPGYGDCGKRTQMKFYFDSVTLQCQQFSYLDCNGGNANRFDSLEQCERFCSSTACENGESLLQGSDGRPVLCAGAQNFCPTDYRCAFDNIYRRHVCCGYKRNGACAVGQMPYMNSLTASPLKCMHHHSGLDIRDACPADFLCAVSADGYTSFCCSPQNGICPAGQSAYIHPLTDKSLKCNPLRYKTDCPIGYVCSATVPGSSWGFCCSERIDAECPEGTQAYVQPGTSLPLKCTVGVSPCSAGYSCQSRDKYAIIGFCCSSYVEETVDSGNSIEEEVTHPSPMLPFIETHTTYTTEAPQPTFIDGNGIEEEHAPGRYISYVTAQPSSFYISKPRRLIDIQKEVDKLFNQDLNRMRPAPRYKPAMLSLKSALIKVFLTCPRNAIPVYYTGTQLVLECNPLDYKRFDCPAGSQCVASPGDVFKRHVCCILPPPAPRRYVYTTPEPPVDPIYIYSVTSAPSLPVQTEYTADPFCPIVESGKQCVSGVPGHCDEHFFCQYNVDRQLFMCCSM